MINLCQITTGQSPWHASRVKSWNMFCVVIYPTILRSTISLLLTNMAFGKGSLLKPSLSPSLTIGCLRWKSESGQMYIVLLNDFSKAFDSVPHQRLLLKLNYYGITGKTVVFFGWRTSCWITLSVSRFLAQGLLELVLPLVSLKAQS